MGYLARGLKMISLKAVPEAVSSVYASAAVSHTEQPEFLNTVLLARTRLDPMDLLRAAHSTEEALGRIRSFRYAPRTLDVDVVFYGDCVFRDTELVIPHPSWKGRSFVLGPLAEVVPDFRAPGEERTVLELWSESRGGLPILRRVAPPHSIWSGGE